MVLLTSKESKQDVVAGLESGADDYLIKPVDPEELKARLLTGLRILQLEDSLVEARENMRFKATHDPLTSLLNRGAIMDLLSRELVRTEREKSSITILLADLDHFKQVNDTYGHLVGDEVLREVAKRLLLSVRSYDLVGRYGGEEFLMVLTKCAATTALARAETIRAAIATFPVKTAAGQLHLTVSLGVLPTANLGHFPLEDVLHEVDVALYAAKKAGRNCSKLAAPEVHSRSVPQS